MKACHCIVTPWRRFQGIKARNAPFTGRIQKRKTYPSRSSLSACNARGRSIQRGHFQTKCSAANSGLFDHLVDSGEYLLRNREAKLPRGTSRALRPEDRRACSLSKSYQRKRQRPGTNRQAKVHNSSDLLLFVVRQAATRRRSARRSFSRRRLSSSCVLSFCLSGWFAKPMSRSYLVVSNCASTIAPAEARAARNDVEECEHEHRSTR